MRLIVISCSIFAALLQATEAFGNEQYAVSAADLAGLRDIGGHARGAISVSPDGRWVAFQLQSPEISDGDYKLTWMALSPDGGNALRVADGGDVLLNPSLNATTNGNRPEIRAKWSPDAKSFAYLVRRDGETQIWRSRPYRAGQTKLTRNASDVIDFAWSTDGLKLYFKVGADRKQVEMRKQEEGVRGFLYDSRFHPTQSTQPIWRVCPVRGSDRVHTVSMERACEEPVWVYDVETRLERLATNEEIEAFSQLHNAPILPELLEGRNIERLRQSADGSGYAWREKTNPETYRGPYAPLTIFALINDEIRQCEEAACRAYDISGNQNLWWRPNGKEIVFSRRDGRTGSQLGFYSWTPETGGLTRLFQTDDWLSDCAPSGDRLICLYEAWTQPRKIVSISLKDGSMTSLYDPNPEFARHQFSKIEKLEWEDAEGDTTFGHLVYPIGYQERGAYPLVIVTYRSRGFLRGGVGDEFPIHPLAAAGVFVLSHDKPSHLELKARHTDFNAKLLEKQYERKSVLSSQEIIIGKLARVGLIDKDRVAITGLSEGQAQVNYALMYSDVDFAAAISSGAHVSSSEYYLMNDTVRDRARRLMYGSPEDPESGLRKLSIGMNADCVDTPLLINVSDEELRGSVENYARLQDANKPVEMYVFPGEHHIKWRPDHRLAIYRRNLQWLKFWLMDEEVDDPIDPDQYSRWRAMRDEQCARLNGADMPWYCENGEVNLAAQYCHLDDHHLKAAAASRGNNAALVSLGNWARKRRAGGILDDCGSGVPFRSPITVTYSLLRHARPLIDESPSFSGTGLASKQNW